MCRTYIAIAEGKGESLHSCARTRAQTMNELGPQTHMANLCWCMRVLCGVRACMCARVCVTVVAAERSDPCMLCRQTKTIVTPAGDASTNSSIFLTQLSVHA